MSLPSNPEIIGDSNNVDAAANNTRATDASSPSSSEPQAPPSYGDVLQQSVLNVQQKLDAYSQALQKNQQNPFQGSAGQDKSTPEHANTAEAEWHQLSIAMSTLTSSQPDPKIRQEWETLVNKASSTETTPSIRKGIVAELIERGKQETKRKTVLGTVIAVPRWVVGTAFYAVGGAAHGIGKIFNGVGGIVKGNGARHYRQSQREA